MVKRVPRTVSACMGHECDRQTDVQTFQ